MITTQNKIIGMMQAAGLSPTGLSRRLGAAGIISESQAKQFLTRRRDTTTAKADAITAWLIEYLNEKG